MTTQVEVSEAPRYGGASGEGIIGMGGNAYSRAVDILRQHPPLTHEPFRELDALLRAVSQPQFAALTDDPAHQRQLQRYEALSWSGRLPTQMFFLIACAAAVLVVAVLVLSR